MVNREALSCSGTRVIKAFCYYIPFVVSYYSYVDPAVDWSHFRGQIAAAAKNNQNMEYVRR